MAKFVLVRWSGGELVTVAGGPPGELAIGEGRSGAGVSVFSAFQVSARAFFAPGWAGFRSAPMARPAGRMIGNHVRGWEGSSSIR